MPKIRTSKIATIALAAGLGLSTGHSALHHVKKPKIESVSKMPEGWECSVDRCTQVNKNPKIKKPNFSKASLRVFEHKDLPIEYKQGKIITEKQLISTISNLPSAQAKLDMIEGFCFRFYVADERGGHFDFAKLQKTITNKKLKKILENFMKNHKELKYKKVLEVD